MSSTREEQLNGMAEYIAERIKPTLATALRMATKCCPNCEHFDGGLDRCRLNNQKPPSTIIAFGCELFSDNQLPF
jgi:hypothetical protein